MATGVERVAVAENIGNGGGELGMVEVPSERSLAGMNADTRALAESLGRLDAPERMSVVAYLLRLGREERLGFGGLDSAEEADSADQESTDNQEGPEDEEGGEGRDKTRLTLSELLSNVGRDKYGAPSGGKLPELGVFAAAVRRDLRRIEHRHEVLDEFLGDVVYDFEHEKDNVEVERRSALAELAQAGEILRDVEDALTTWFASEDAIARWGPAGRIPTFEEGCWAHIIKRLADAIRPFSISDLYRFEDAAKAIVARIQAEPADGRRQENADESANLAAADADDEAEEDEVDDDEAEDDEPAADGLALPEGALPISRSAAKLIAQFRENLAPWFWAEKDFLQLELRVFGAVPGGFQPEELPTAIVQVQLIGERGLIEKALADLGSLARRFDPAVKNLLAAD